MKAIVLMIFTVSRLVGVITPVQYADTQVTGSCGSLQRIESATRMAMVIYPELVGRELSLTFSEGVTGALSSPVDARRFLIVVDKPQWHPAKENRTSIQQEKKDATQLAGLHLPVYLEFNFIPPAQLKTTTYRLSCHPLDFSNTAPTQGREARAEVDEHPEWSDAEMLKAARAHGMRYGPGKKADVLRLIPLKALATFYGPLRIKSAKFEIYGNTIKCEGCSFADLHWWIKAEVVGTPRKLQIIIEPFEGKIVNLSEYDPSKWPRPE